MNRNNKKNHVWKENHIALSQEVRLEDIKVQNRESERQISKKQHLGFKRFNIWRSKITLKKTKNQVSPKSTDKKSKPEWKLRFRSQMSTLRPQAKHEYTATKMLKQKMKIYSNEAEKERQLERKIQFEETKKIPRQDQTIQTKQDFQSSKRKVYLQVGRERAKSYHNRMQRR